MTPTHPAPLVCGRFELDFKRPRIMAIVNLTPDSFSGDGLGRDLDQALLRAENAVQSGADILDLGGESSRPGANPVSEQEELDRVMPLIERLHAWRVPLSVDTVKPGVMKAALHAGVDLVNDIHAFLADGAIEAVRHGRAGLCVMHMRGLPQTMQAGPRYEDVVGEVTAFLVERTGALQRAGIAKERIVVDPGFGFGKTLDHNLALLRALDRIAGLGFPVLAGLSRKSMLGQITGREVGERQVASVAAALLAVQRGATIVRVHDVAETRDALKIWEAVQEVAAVARSPVGDASG